MRINRRVFWAALTAPVVAAVACVDKKMLCVGYKGTTTRLSQGFATNVSDTLVMNWNGSDWVEVTAAKSTPGRPSLYSTKQPQKA